MITNEEKRKLVFKVVTTILATLLPLSALRVLLIHGNLTFMLFIKEMLFSIVFGFIVVLILYMTTKKEIKEINSKARNYAFRDALTGLYNRHYLNDFLAKFKRLHKKESIFAVAFIDIDKFKEINDTLGHEAGDCILRCLALKLKSLTRSTDILCRYGGEEFVIIYNDTSKKEMFEKMEQIRESIQNSSFECEHTNITISIGLSFGKKEDDINEILQEADKALYMAKNAGRNCVKIFLK
ncbi:MAG: GGDEF domain-containing protein [Sulfurimonas sp.]|uniref:GGDEF domain-containing protein n=1 Tax=Sulfurimonas sp. TaxID=2022749 RepID=UPI003D0D861F